MKIVKITKISSSSKLKELPLVFAKKAPYTKMPKDKTHSGKMDTQMYPECEGTDQDRDIVKKQRNKKKSFNLSKSIKIACDLVRTANYAAPVPVSNKGLKIAIWSGSGDSPIYVEEDIFIDQADVINYANKHRYQLVESYKKLLEMKKEVQSRSY